ncbi:UPF0182 family protein [Flexivirga aerilata]|uniref:UPF0182 family membrane protein n=1 Tax=Flexivirga aerilata TaxID=1656889 RepID=UPI001FE3CAD8|nr:UPF0182 family protein [Flexivirga aerilata]
MSSSDDAADSGNDQSPDHPRVNFGRVGVTRGRRLLIAVLAVIALVVLVQVWANVWTTKLWFDSLGYSAVFRTEYLTKGTMFVAGGLLTGLLIFASMLIAYRSRPLYAPATPELDNMDRYREAIEPFRKVAFWVIPILFGLFAGSAAAGQWKLALLWLNRQSFGVKDPEFHKDVGFYVFTLPWLQLILSYLTMALILSLVAAVVMHYLYGGISLQGVGVRTTSAARIHLSLILAVLVLGRALAYWLGRYDQTARDNSLFTGIDYTAQNAVLPSKALLAGAALICAALFVATIWTRTWRLPIVGLAFLLVCAIVLGAIYPALVQRFRVRPSEQSLQSPYISRNIEATKTAYGLNNVKTETYSPVTDTNRNQLQKDQATVPGIRLVDPSIVSPTFRQLQGQRNYYQFGNTLDVDRYSVDGKSQDAVVGVRELDLDGVPPAQRNWVNDHTVYTHGFGFVAAKGNERTADGQPVFMESNIPPQGDLGKYEPRIYFGESSPQFSIVGGPANGPKRELDYPDSKSGGEQRTTYTGGGGVGVGSWNRRLAYAVKYHDYNFLFSGSINDRSRILDTRNPVDRLKKVAPWLTVDGDPYPVVEDGRIEWVVDGYTTSAQYPNSQLQSLGNATADSLTTTSENLRTLAGGRVNYIRNSVKATVDAYTGKVTMYAWDEKDPVLKAWMSAFPGTVKPMSQISAGLMSHLRYPEDLFKVQRELLTKYHVTDPGQFFQGNDQWQIPTDPTSEGAQQPPYYLSLAMPGQSTPTFSLTTTFIPTGTRQNLSAFMAVDADAGSTAGQKRPGYGVFRVIEMPRNATVKGPGQFQNDINSSQAVSPTTGQTLSQFLTYNKQVGSQVQEGNLLTLPIGDGLLYVEPIYVRAAGSTSFPLQKAVVVEFGDNLAWDVTLDGALNELFGGQSGATAGDEGTAPQSTPAPSPSGSASPTPSPSGSASPTPSGNQSLQQALSDVQKWYDQGQADLKKGDFAAYGKSQEELKNAIKRAIDAQGGTGSAPSGGGGGGSGSGGSSAKPSPSPTSTR